MSYVLVGGTFDGLHKAHRKIISKAFEAEDKVLVCLTSDEMVEEKHLSWKIESYEKRKAKLEEFLRKKRWLSKAEIVKIEDPFSEGLRPDLTHIIVSSESRANGEKINEMRSDNSLGSLKIIELKRVLAEDGKPISDRRIRKGEIDRNGHILR